MGAAIAIAIAVCAAAGSVLTVALRALAAERRAGDQKSRADVLDANHTVVSVALADTAAQLKEAQERIDDMANELAQCAADMPTDGAYVRLLSKIRTVKTSSDHSEGALHLSSAAEPGLSTALLKPGDDD